MTGQPREEVKLDRFAQYQHLREEEDAVPIWSVAAPIREEEGAATKANPGLREDKSRGRKLICRKPPHMRRT